MVLNGTKSPFGTEWYSMVPNASQLYMIVQKMVPNCNEWYPFVLNGSQLYQMIPNDTKYPMLPNFIEWCKLIPYGAGWCGMVLIGGE